MDSTVDEVARLGPWFHNLRVDGVETAPEHALGDFPAAFFAHFSHAIPADLTGRTVLDVGCNAGFYSMEMKRRGADRVLGIDTEPLYLHQARYATGRLGIDVELREMSVYDVHELRESFDLVLFLGVFYHLRYPLLALDVLRRYAVRGLMLFQSMQRGPRDLPDVAPDYAIDDASPFEDPAWPRMQFVEHAYGGDAGNWWIPNRAAVEASLRSAGFAIEARPDTEVYLCRPAGAPPAHPLPGGYPTEPRRA